MRIGILGGTFNPVHNGHLHIASRALRKLRLNKVIFVPACIPPHKKFRGNAKPSDRLRMLRLAIAGEKRFSVSEYEIKRRETSYSIKTVLFLRRKFGSHTKLFFIIGADMLAGLKSWRQASRLLRLAQFAVVPRSHYAIEASACAGVYKLRIPARDVSSSEIRKRIRSKKPIGRLVPRAVSAYIKERDLYK